MDVGRSEGCIPAMGNAETSPDWTQILQSLPDVKQHGPQPEMCVSTPMALNLRQASKVVKRSLLRAQRRAECFGMTWYRGKCLTLADFAKMGMPPTQALAQAPRTKDVMSCHSHNKPKKTPHVPQLERWGTCLIQVGRDQNLALFATGPSSSFDRDPMVLPVHME